jgi:hypothetical protein
VIGRVLKANRHILFATLFLSIVLLLTHATLLYFIMRHVDPQLFGRCVFSVCLVYVCVFSVFSVCVFSLCV